jgi:16S rRNA (cytosine967-C5)-methyltransferase
MLAPPTRSIERHFVTRIFDVAKLATRLPQLLSKFAIRILICAWAHALLAAMEVIAAIDREHRPRSVALADWGRSHRFAGSGDRSAIGTIVYDVLRRRRSLAAQMGSDKPRGLVLAAAVRACGLSPGEIEVATASGEAHAPAPVTADERQRLEGGLPDDTPLDVCADLPSG